MNTSVGNSINRNIVECKEITNVINSVKRLVLIETLWNVKRDNGVPIYWDYQVLIETLWNVKNCNNSLEWADDIGINRNIVECKDVRHDGTGSRRSLY